MNSDQALGLACAERGWRLQRLGDRLFVFDEHSGQMARVDERIAAALPESAYGTRLMDVLRNARDAGIGETRALTVSDDAFVVSLRLLGVRVDVHCAYQQCADAIGDFFSASVVEPTLSGPEVVVWCGLKTPGRHMFRARPDDDAGEPLRGVSVQTLRSSRKEWTSTLPPLPALGVWPFQERFAALHAAAVRTSKGKGVLIAGDRGAGKSTAALSLSGRLGAEMLGDETAFVHCRTSLVEPFPHAVGVWRNARKVQVPITELGVRICNHAVPVTVLLFLERRAEGVTETSRLSQSDSLRALLPHHRSAGASIGDAMQTLFRLAAEAESWLITYSVPDEMLAAVSDLVYE